MILYAPNVRSHGGLILLKNLLEYNSKFEAFYLPVELKDDYEKILNRSFFYSKGFFERIRAEKDIISHKSKRVLSFNNYPPLLSMFYGKQEVFVYFHNANILQSRVLRMLHSLSRLRVKKIIVQSHIMEQLVLENFRYLPHEVLVAPFYENYKAKSEHMEPEITSFLCVTSEAKNKNNDRLVTAFAKVCQLSSDLTLALTLERSMLSADSLKLIDSLPENFSLLGSLDHHSLLQKYDEYQALVVPSVNESFCMPLLEAGNFCLKVLASDMEYSHEFVVPDEVFNPFDVDSIARAINRVRRKLPQEYDFSLVNLFRGIEGEQL